MSDLNNEKETSEPEDKPALGLLLLSPDPAIPSMAADDIHRRIVSELIRRGTDEGLERAIGLCGEPDIRERRIGVDVLAELGLSANGERPLRRRIVPLVLEMIDDPINQQGDMLGSLLWALYRQGDVSNLPVILRYKGYDDVSVRTTIAFLLGECGYQSEPVISTLIEMTTDPDSLVRQEATAQLASIGERDNPAIRAAIEARLLDENVYVRNDAIRGFIRWGEDRGIEALLKELESDEPDFAIVNTAADAADPQLMPALLRIRERGVPVGEKDLRWAIDRCQAQTE